MSAGLARTAAGGDAELVTSLLFAVLILATAFFAVRPEVWRRLWFASVDARPAALTRIAFGAVVLWTFLRLGGYARFAFTDEGLWLTGGARARFGGPLRFLWDPEQGFEHWWSPVAALGGSFTVLHLRSDPPFVFVLYALLLASLSLMVLGLATRWTTLLSWVLAEQLYRYGPVFLNGGDLVIRAFLFLAIFCRWGDAYSIDAWRRRRAAVAAGEALPFPPRIPAWPQCLMMLQLACIYCVNGFRKDGAAWQDGTAIYYALNLDHFYRVPAQGLVTWLQYVGVLPLLTWAVRWWELLFPIALAGAALGGYEADRAAGRWPGAPPWRRWLSWLLAGAAWLAGAAVLGVLAGREVDPAALLSVTRDGVRLGTAILAAAAPVLAVPTYRAVRARLPGAFRFFLRWVVGPRPWLLFGVALHLGIDVGMNVGTFAEVMIAVYGVWLSGPEADALVRRLAGPARALGRRWIAPGPGRAGTAPPAVRTPAGHSP